MSCDIHRCNGHVFNVSCMLDSSFRSQRSHLLTIFWSSECRLELQKCFKNLNTHTWCLRCFSIGKMLTYHVQISGSNPQKYMNELWWYLPIILSQELETWGSGFQEILGHLVNLKPTWAMRLKKKPETQDAWSFWNYNTTYSQCGFKGSSLISHVMPSIDHYFKRHLLGLMRWISH